MNCGNIYLDSKEISITLKDILSSTLVKPLSQNKEIIILCIGTDRSTGDALGPLIGWQLSQHKYLKNITYGTLESPIHALNLVDKINEINEKHSNPFIMVIDATLGEFSKLGDVRINLVPLCPGSCLSKDLPKVGDLTITGVVALLGNDNFKSLQNTSLNLTMNLSKAISKGIKQAFNEILKKR